MSCFIEKSPQNNPRRNGIFFFFGGGGGGGWGGEGEKIRNEEKSLKTGNKYHATGTIGSNLTYLATPGQVSMGVGLFIGTPVMP